MLREHVVIGDLIKIRQCRQQRALTEMNPFPRRFTGEHDPRAIADSTAKTRELPFIKVMQKQICDHNLCLRQSGFIEDALLQPGDVMVQFVRPWREIDGCDLFCLTDASMQQRAAQSTIARAEFENAPTGFHHGFQPTNDPTVIAHDAVDQAQFVAAADRSGIIGWEMIEDFGFDNTVHGSGTKPREAARAPYLYFASTSAAFAGSTFS